MVSIGIDPYPYYVILILGRHILIISHSWRICGMNTLFLLFSTSLQSWQEEKALIMKRAQEVRFLIGGLQWVIDNVAWYHRFSNTDTKPSLVEMFWDDEATFLVVSNIFYVP